MKKLVASLALLALIGAGCPSAAPSTGPTGQTTPPQPVPTRMGFGKLPSIGSTSSQGTVAMMANGEVTRNAAAPTDAVAPTPAPMMAAQGASGAGGAPSAMIARPIPIPPPNLKPVAVKYNITASLPDWGTDSDVLEVQRMQADVAMVRSFAAAAGLPSPLVSGIADVQSINVSWKDTDGFVWNTDAASHMLNWWKQDNQVMPVDANTNQQPPTVKASDADLIAAADTFLRSHGLGAVADQGATVEQYNQPCVYERGVAVPEAASTGAAGSVTVSSDSAVKMMYPSPCPYYPVQANVYYGAMREGKTVVDMGGWPSRISSVNVDVSSLKVMGGNVVYAENVSRSSYPLLDKDTVMKRLQTGGRNPVYPWGNETKDISVTIDKVELAWLRYDSYADNQQQTYYIPAIAASGHVDRGMKDQPVEEYHTTVALVTDDAFGGDVVTPPPVIMPMMQGGSAPATAPAPAPVKY